MSLDQDCSMKDPFVPVGETGYSRARVKCMKPDQKKQSCINKRTVTIRTFRTFTTSWFILNRSSLRRVCSFLVKKKKKKDVCRAASHIAVNRLLHYSHARWGQQHGSTSPYAQRRVKSLRYSCLSTRAASQRTCGD